jgi:hypothetical protein
VWAAQAVWAPHRAAVATAEAAAVAAEWDPIDLKAIAKKAIQE